MKVDLKGNGFDGVKDCVQDTGQWRALVNMLMNFKVSLKATGTFLTT
jgi:hypothetical protein